MGVILRGSPTYIKQKITIMGQIRNDIPFYTPSKHFCMEKHHTNGRREVLFNGDYTGEETRGAVVVVMCSVATILVAILLISLMLFL